MRASPAIYKAVDKAAAEYRAGKISIEEASQRIVNAGIDAFDTLCLAERFLKELGKE